MSLSKMIQLYRLHLVYVVYLYEWVYLYKAVFSKFILTRFEIFPKWSYRKTHVMWLVCFSPM